MASTKNGATAKPKPWRPNGKGVNYLYAWSVGAVRHFPNWPARRACPVNLYAAEQHGYIEVVDVPTSGSSASAAYRRTDKPITPYKPRGPKPDYVGEFPWPVERHWERLKESPARLVARTAYEITSAARKAVNEYVTQSDLGIYQHRPLEDKLAATLFVGTIAELKEVRTSLLRVFAGKAPTAGWKAKHLDTLSGLPGRLEPLFLSGWGIRVICCDLQIEPVFTDRTFTGFVARDVTEAYEELQALMSSGDTIADRYLTFMETRHG